MCRSDEEEEKEEEKEEEEEDASLCLFTYSCCLLCVFSLTACLCFIVFTACPPGTFKSTQGPSLCLQCPPNSRSTAEAATVCVCRNGYYRGDADQPDEPCTSEFDPYYQHHSAFAGFLWRTSFYLSSLLFFPSVSKQPRSPNYLARRC